MRPKVYLESSLISYLAARPSRHVVTAANQRITLLWWEKHRQDFDLYVSQLVVWEIEDGDPGAAKKRLSLVGTIPALNLTQESLRMARELRREMGLPRKAWRDVLHLTLAADHGMDFLLTWNCRHIANAALFPRFGSIISSWGRRSPILCTPPQLMEGGL